jgi:hypothetical protein
VATQIIDNSASSTSIIVCDNCPTAINYAGTMLLAFAVRTDELDALVEKPSDFPVNTGPVSECVDIKPINKICDNSSRINDIQICRDASHENPLEIYFSFRSRHVAEQHNLRRCLATF